MARPVILSNGSLAVGLNEQGLVHDFYYPYVGLDNLTTSRSAMHKIGIWVDGQFSWVDEDNWQINVDFSSDALISNVEMKSEKLAISLKFNDFVDHEFNAFCRYVQVTNHADQPREVRLFMHQVFQISRGGRADTALYVPDEHYILDYKGRCCLLIYGQSSSGEPYDQFAVGNYGIEGKEGTFKDAEDGELSGSAVEHGGVDSIIRFKMSIKEKSAENIEYWIIAADSQFKAERIHTKFKKDTLTGRINETNRYWQKWLSQGSNGLHAIDKEYLEITKKSLLLIKAHIDKRGGVIASCDSSIYNYGRDYYSYVWPRDGAFVVWPLIRLGYYEEAKKFFEFCRDILTEDGYLMHKYQPDRSIGSTWHPLIHENRKELAIQEDETAIVIYMLGEYLRHSDDVDFIGNLYDTLIQPAANFMAEFIDKETGLPHASYDLWEEKFLTNTFTVAVTYQALQTAADFADKFEYPDDAITWRVVADSILKKSNILFDEARGAYRKGYLLAADGTLRFDNTLDVSSLYGVVMFGMHDFNVGKIKSTVNLVEKLLLDQSPSGGSPRYEDDNYFASDPKYVGNPWFVTTLWMAQYYIKAHKPENAAKYLDWTIKHILPSGALSEQINPTNGSPLSVAPLVWSHAEFINTVLDLAAVTDTNKKQ